MQTLYKFYMKNGMLKWITGTIKEIIDLEDDVLISKHIVLKTKINCMIRIGVGA